MDKKNKEWFNERAIDYQIKRIKNPPGLAAVSNKVPESELQKTLHEKLALKQMYKFYERILSLDNKIKQLQPQITSLSFTKKKTLKDLQKQFSKQNYHFWRMQDKFVEFIKPKTRINVNDWIKKWKALENKEENKKKLKEERRSLENQLQYTEKTGYLLNASWVFANNEKYREEFKDITPEQLKEKKQENYKQYNQLCREIYQLSPSTKPKKYNPLDDILI